MQATAIVVSTETPTLTTKIADASGMLQLCLQVRHPETLYDLHNARHLLGWKTEPSIPPSEYMCAVMHLGAQQFGFISKRLG